MPLASSRSPDGWDKIQERFGEFGYLSFWCKIPSAKPRNQAEKIVQAALTEWTLDIKLQPSGLTGDPSDSEIREAMYSIAEDAIAVAQENYHLISGPAVKVWGGELEYNYLEGELRLEFTMKGNPEK
jgi:hypothetical protein